MANTVRSRLHWRVVDIVVASIIAVASGVIFAGWDLIYKIPTVALDAVLPGFQGLVQGIWLFAAPLAAIIVRKPGAALYAELVAAAVEYVIGAGGIFGITGSITIGFIQGLFAEIAFLIMRYRVWNIWMVIFSGALSGFSNYLYEFSPLGARVAVGYFSTYGIIYFISAILSGAVIAGLLMWYVYRALAKTGVLDRFDSGRTATLV